MINKKTKQIVTSVLSVACMAFTTVGAAFLPNNTVSAATVNTQTQLVKLTDDYVIPTMPKSTIVKVASNALASGQTQFAQKVSGSTESLGDLDKTYVSTGSDQGLLVTSAKSGDAAEGTTFSLGTYSGAFSIDFRVFSQNTYEGAINGKLPGGGYTSMSEEMNPYNDLQSMTLRFTEKETNGRSFDIVFESLEERCRILVYK